MTTASPAKVAARLSGRGELPPYMPVFPPFTEADVIREAATLDRLAEETARADPWTAATNLFGGAR